MVSGQANLISFEKLLDTGPFRARIFLTPSLPYLGFGFPFDRPTGAEKGNTRKGYTHEN